MFCCLAHFTFRQVLFWFLFTISWPGDLTEIRLPVFFFPHNLVVLPVSLLGMVKLKFISEFPVDHLSHSVIPCFIVFSTNWLHSLIKLLLFTLLEFFSSVSADGFSLEFEWQQVSLNFQDSSQDSYNAVLSNAVIWIVSTRPPTSKSSRPFNNPLVIVPNAPITNGTMVTFMFTRFFNSLARSRYLSFFSLSLRFILWSAGTAKSTILKIFFFFFFVDFYKIWSSGRDQVIRLFVNVP